MKLLRRLLVITFLSISFLSHPVKSQQIINSKNLVQNQRISDSLIQRKLFLKANRYLIKINDYYQKKEQWKRYFSNSKQIITNLIRAQRIDQCENKIMYFLNFQEKSDNNFKHFLYSILSYIYTVKGNVHKALELQEKLLSFYKKESNLTKVARLYLSISNTTVVLGAYSVAQNYLYKAIFLLKKTNNTKQLSNAYHNLSSIYIAQNNFKEALKFSRKSLEIRKKIKQKNNSNIDASQRTIGIIYSYLGNYQKALLFFQKCLDSRRKQHSNKHHSIAGVLFNIGSTYSRQQKYDSALIYYNKALEIWKKYNSTTSIANTYNYIAQGYVSQHNYSKALPKYQKALFYNSKKHLDSNNFRQNPKEYFSTRLLLQSLKGKASVLQAIGDTKSLKVALETYQLCDEVIQKLRQQYVNYQDKLTLANLSAEIYEQAVMACYQMIQKQPAKEAQYTALAFQFSERNKASILREALQEANAKFDLPTNLVEQERDLKINLAYYEKQLASAQNRKDSTKVVRFQNKLFDLNREREQMTQMLEKRYPRYYQLKYNTQLADIATIKKRLPDKALLVEYFTTDKQSFAFVVAKTQCKMLVLPGGKNVRKIIRKYGRNLKTRKPVAYFAPSAYAAYQQLIQPLETYLKNKEQFIVVADNALLGIPFEALISQKVSETTKAFADLPFLIKQFSFSYHYSANLMVQPMLRNAQPKQNSFLGFAPVFTKSVASKTRDNSVKSLPYTEKEVDKIIEVFKQQGQTNVKAVLHQNATEEAFKKVGQNFRFVHLATHSVTNSKRPELAYIQFEPTPQHQTNFNEGRLYANEIYALHLNADLVVLSSCESGSGKIERGEGMMGLNRGFLYAGARNVIYSLWKVNDRPTSAFMIRFYQNLIEQKYSFHKALQQTKLQYLKENPQNRPHDWAGFLIIGQL